MAARATQMWSGQLISRGLGATSRQPTPAFRGFLRHTPFSVPRLPASSFHQSARAICRTERTLISRRFRSLRFSSDKRTPNPTPHLQSPEPELSVSQRLKKLSREYGWTAVGVYFALSALDFPFCFLAVRTLGADRIAHYEHAVVEGFWNILRIPFPNIRKAKEQEGISSESAADAAAREGNIVWGDEIEQAEALNRGANASIWTQLALAYVIHKSFIFLRVPLTAAILPKVVKTLRGWGWNIGKRTPKTSN